MFEEILATSQGRVLRFLARHIGQSFYEQEIVEHTDVSRSAVNLATRALYRAGLLLREREVHHSHRRTPGFSVFPHLLRASRKL